MFGLVLEILGMNKHDDYPQERPLLIAAVIPCYKVKDRVLAVLNAIGPEVTEIIVIDDACPEKTADYIAQHFKDKRLSIIRHEQNEGVGGAVISGYKLAIEKSVDIIVKIDGDGQIDPSLVPTICAPIILGLSDYVKGNRFFTFSDSRSMPIIRKVGNLGLSFITKFSSGYMNIFDPTNGFTAIHVEVAKALPLDKISRRFFFESDMLFHLNCVRAVVTDIPIIAVYKDEISNLKISKVALEFFFKNLSNVWRRVILNYFLRDFNIGSAQLLVSLPLILWSFCFGGYMWIVKYSNDELASAGTVMLAALPMILGMQLFLGFLSYDMYNSPKIPLHRLMTNNMKVLLNHNRK